MNDLTINDAVNAFSQVYRDEIQKAGRITDPAEFMEMVVEPEFLKQYPDFKPFMSSIREIYCEES